MTSKTYAMGHSCVRIDGLDGLWGILLHTGDRVWVQANQSEIGADRIQISDGISTGFDRDGICIISVPASACLYFTQAEADATAEMEAFGQPLMEYARGALPHRTHTQQENATSIRDVQRYGLLLFVPGENGYAWGIVRLKDGMDVEELVEHEGGYFSALSAALAGAAAWERFIGQSLAGPPYGTDNWQPPSF
jgi:hypothetical protein